MYCILDSGVILVLNFLISRIVLWLYKKMFMFLGNTCWKDEELGFL